MTHSLTILLVALPAGTISVILALLAIRWLDRRNSGLTSFRAQAQLIAGPEPIIFLFRGNNLVDATGPAKNLMGAISDEALDLIRLTAWLERHFPDLPQRLPDLPAQGRIEVAGETGSGVAAMRLVIEDISANTVRVTINDPMAENAGIMVDSLTLLAMEQELELLRSSMNHTPMLAWRQDGQGNVTWANAAYLTRADEIAEGELSWPLPRLLDLPSLPGGTSRLSRRAQLESRGSVLWFDCHAHRSGNQTMFFALPADAAVRAERGLREFVQTLTKTFADLPTGLAIFDRDRNLQLFNPALIDLTGLSAGFLIARPTLFDFLDKLRDARMVPEPKDYRSWRQQMNNLESAAATGRHVETWSLPGGQTYRVTGRPHPDGAVAFLLEDITSEISLTRKFRADLNLGALVLDGIDDALVVFGANGQFLLCNKAYEELWGGKSGSVTDAIEDWRGQVAAGAGFTALCDRLSGRDDASRSNGAVAAPAGGMLSWSVRALSGGRQLVRFRMPETETADPARPTDKGGRQPHNQKAVGA
ncbi:PAS domain-containing protein [Paracoccus sp. M683]|uniref:PAS-domain containing protein n=1 Tax=Paracoccus sp. M683 TaxID=2594268 RepID=UPI0011807C0B|nr:PAS domain-containing protein [Paracoccus sp. M683]TRW98809.1 PAS domain-containing protein [Paracoccus sp. M683]